VNIYPLGNIKTNILSLSVAIAILTDTQNIKYQHLKFKIMSTFFNFFKKNKKVDSVPSQEGLTKELIEPLNAIIPMEDLFVDNEEPFTKPETSEIALNEISEFLNRDYQKIGLNDGYEYHSKETQQMGESKIKAEFHLILDKSMQVKNEIKLQMKNLLVDVNNISSDSSKKLENTLEEIYSSINLLQKQKELSIENEGWVMNCIHSYRKGFLQGLNDYITGETLLNSIKNI
jgi:hypothetical protein